MAKALWVQTVSGEFGLSVVWKLTVLAIGSLNGMAYVRKMTVNRVDLSKIADGAYPGTFTHGRFSYSVEVTVNGHRIVAITSTDSRQATSAATEQIFERIVQEQSVAVDTVSGASLTTKAVSKAVENALTPGY